MDNVIPLFKTENTDLFNCDCLEFMKSYPDNSIDAIVTDPPYGLSFMGKKWDYDVPSEEIWVECLRILKPGGHILAFAGTRTQHRMAVRIEDAGFEIRDMIAWVYGSGFPKSLNISIAMDKKEDSEREVVHTFKRTVNKSGIIGETERIVRSVTAPSSDIAKQWDGWGTALKPSLEPITVARKPLIGTVVDNVLEYGTGGINIDGCRVGTESTIIKRPPNSFGSINDDGWKQKEGFNGSCFGRWPANFIHDGSDDVTSLFPMSQGGAFPKTAKPSGFFGGICATSKNRIDMNDGGLASRFFYCAKASKADRDEGCEWMDAIPSKNPMVDFPSEIDCGSKRGKTLRKNHHPTVKPADLMRYLCRLVTPKNGLIFDPFMGSGSTGKACILEGFKFVGCERETDFYLIAKARIVSAEERVKRETAQMTLGV